MARFLIIDFQSIFLVYCLSFSNHLIICMQNISDYVLLELNFVVVLNKEIMIKYKAAQYEVTCPHRHKFASV